MPLFKLHCIRAGTENKEVLYYDNLTSQMFDSNMTQIRFNDQDPPDWSKCPDMPRVSAGSPGKKDVAKTFRLKIKLGLSCNYRCSYCIQGHDVAECKALPFDELIALFPDNMKPNIIELWGGEPYLYWETLKPLVEALRDKYPEVDFYTATNGSLLTPEIIEWITKIGKFHISVSHDGPGQPTRGKDPLADPYQRTIIFDLFKRQPEMFSFNAMTYKQNASRKEINDWFRVEIEKEMGKDFQFNIGEGALFSPKVPEHKEYCLIESEEVLNYRRMVLEEIRENLAPNVQIIGQRMNMASDIISKTKPLRTTGSRCGADREDVLVIDLAGNVYTCQNASVGDIAANGQSAKIGTLFDLDNIANAGMTHWSYKKECVNCPVLVLCLGGCPTGESNPEVQKLNCDMQFNDNISFLAAVIECLTGCLPYYIEGPQPADRKDIFGAVAEGHEKLLD
jgi:uncharacterized protein